MTKDEHKSAIVTQLQQQSLNLLVDSLAAALAVNAGFELPAE